MTVTTRRVTAGFGWVALCNYSNRLLGLVTTLLLAKLLVPADFGLVAIASMVLEMIQVLKDMGLSEAVIYNKREDRSAVDTAHTILVGYSVCLFLVAAAMAPVTAHFYGNPTIVPIVLLMASTLVVNSLRSVPLTLARKNLDYAKLVIPDVVSVAVASAVSILMALAGFGVWSLVVKTVLHSALALVLLQFVLPYRPRFAFDRAAARELLQYGRFIVGASLLLVTLYNIDKFYVSRFAGVAALGLFVLAMRIAELPVQQFSFLVGNVMFPVFSKMERSGQGLRMVFLKTLKYTASATLPMAAGLSLFGPPLVRYFYGPEWDGLAVPLRMLALYAALRSLSSIICDLFKATGHPHLMQRGSAFRLASVGVLGVPALRLAGLPGMSLLLIVTYAAVLSWEIHRLAGILRTSPSAIASVLVRPVVLSSTVLPAAYMLMSRTTGLETLGELALGIGFAGVAYSVALYWLDRDVAVDFKALRASIRAPAPEPLR